MLTEGNETDACDGRIISYKMKRINVPISSLFNRTSLASELGELELRIDWYPRPN